MVVSASPGGGPEKAIENNAAAHSKVVSGARLVHQRENESLRKATAKATPKNFCNKATAKNSCPITAAREITGCVPGVLPRLPSP